MTLEIRGGYIDRNGQSHEKKDFLKPRQVQIPIIYSITLPHEINGFVFSTECGHWLNHGRVEKISTS